MVLFLKSLMGINKRILSINIYFLNIKHYGRSGIKFKAKGENDVLYLTIKKELPLVSLK